MTKSVVLIIGFNRPIHLNYCLEAVFNSLSVKEFDFLFVLDGPLDDQMSSDREKCAEVFEEYLKKAKGLNLNSSFINRGKNLGLKKNVISSIYEAASSYEFVTVLEDDIVVNKYFLKFILKHQHLLKKKTSFGCISGHVPFQFGEQGMPTEAISHFYMNCWGWAGSTSSFKKVIFDPRLAWKIFKDLSRKRKFNFYNRGTSKWQLKANLAGKKNTWAVYWYLFLFSMNKHTIYPSRSLTLNIGNDGSGVNSGNINTLDSSKIAEFINEDHFFLHNSSVREDRLFDIKYKSYIKTEKPKLLNRIYDKLNSLLRKYSSR